MDDGSDSHSIWRKIGGWFRGRHADTVEQAILEAGEEGELDTEERSMLLSILTLDELQVRDIMTPRTDIACLPHNATITTMAELIVSTGHSRIPVFSENRDNIVGIVHAKDLIQDLLDPDKRRRELSKIMRDPFFVPESKNVLDLLHEFRSRKNHLAIILDEYGGTAGLVTIEDVLEQIVGDIEDEHDAPREEVISLQGDGSYLVNGRAGLDDLNESLHLSLESDEVDTIGGYLTHLAGRVPMPGESFTPDDAGGAVFTIMESNPKHINSVRLVLPGSEKLRAAKQEAGAGDPADKQD
ncbi:MAG: hemolysin family protein [Desulfovibrio sp.]|nr:hemolysin family protein [Desulfovibrio sp.]